jgi:hypothetical protein
MPGFWRGFRLYRRWASSLAHGRLRTFSHGREPLFAGDQKMKLFLWLMSGVSLVTIWPFAAMMTTFAFDNPNVPFYEEIIRAILGVTLLAFPIVWFVALILSIVEARGQRREKLLRRYAAAPCWVGIAHLLIWVGVFAVMIWSQRAKPIAAAMNPAGLHHPRLQRPHGCLSAVIHV